MRLFDHGSAAWSWGAGMSAKLVKNPLSSGSGRCRNKGAESTETNPSLPKLQHFGTLREECDCGS